MTLFSLPKTRKYNKPTEVSAANWSHSALHTSLSTLHFPIDTDGAGTVGRNI